MEMRRRIAAGRPLTEDDDDDDGGPNSPNAGVNRIPRRQKARVDNDLSSFGGLEQTQELPLALRDNTRGPDEDSDSEVSEIDIGILSQSKVKLRKKKMAAAGMGESELILQSVQHIAMTLARRSDVVKGRVLQEMREVKLICGVISDVLEILGRRGVDLCKQQKNFIECLGY